MNNHIKMLVICFMLIFFLPYLIPASQSNIITAITGEVDVTRPGEEARPVNMGDEIFVGDIIRTKSSSKVEIRFSDGSIMRLAESSRVEIREFSVGPSGGSAVFKLFRGKVQSIVKMLADRAFGIDKADRYEIETPTAIVGVRGTNFFTYYIGGISGSAFKEGAGYGYSLNRPDEIININAGQLMVVTSPDVAPLLRPVTDFEMLNHEKETSPAQEGSGLTGGLDSGTADVFKREESLGDLFIKEGVDNKMPGTDMLQRGVDIPPPVSSPSHTEPYRQ
ncbi:MAG: FecR domain-containing protein [Deltaproteobacteria bacterium]|nr:FecR domain-containing protein [Deltaproteobacteria bacterium]